VYRVRCHGERVFAVGGEPKRSTGPGHHRKCSTSNVSAARGSARPLGPGLTLGATDDRAVPTHPRELSARLSALFERDVEFVEWLNDAQRHLRQAGERLCSGLAPDAFGVVYDGAAAAAIGSSPITALIRDGGPAANSAMLEALQQFRWKIHRAFCAYQDASEQRRQLAIEVGESSQQLTQALCAAGCSAQQALQANVNQLAGPA
jgi:hypothetical protein